MYAPLVHDVGKAFPEKWPLSGFSLLVGMYLMAKLLLFLPINNNNIHNPLLFMIVLSKLENVIQYLNKYINIKYFIKG